MSWLYHYLFGVLFFVHIVSIYVHRFQAHGVVHFNRWFASVLHIFVRVMLGIDPLSWGAVHPEHHKFVDTPRDPHSPWVYGRPQVAFNTIGLHGSALKHVTRKPRSRYEYTALDRMLEYPWPHTNIPVASYGFLGAVCYTLAGWGIGSALAGFGMWLAISGTCALLFGLVNCIGHSSPDFAPQVGHASNASKWWALFTAGEAPYHLQHHLTPGEYLLGRFDTAGWIIHACIKVGLATR